MLHALHTGLLDPQSLIDSSGGWALLVICGIVFCETGLLIGFFLPGDTLLFFTGVLTFTGHITQPLWVTIPAIIVAAIIGDQVGFLIGRRTGPTIFERREAGLISKASVVRTQHFFDRFGPAAVTIARFVPVVRTIAPVAAGVGHMRRRVFTLFNVIGAVVWTTAVVLLGYWLGHIPGVADFVSKYLDYILIGIVVISIVPLLIRLISSRKSARRRSEAEAAGVDAADAGVGANAGVGADADVDEVPR
ncbi:DedA family protein [Diaminobutyricibacter tongyongensis]|uniref:DedA family protein n=1 Tax=Leifsonia tongyongensis TaxID=1268043 RepID=A0A6L9XWF9_9MICO|nr:VTT domain-containing protein [Diaminobutyricibacter tongyongensis]NEN05781.1 DedA family protein [Diaminobutyricibacter tongyongensis]